MVHQVSHSNVHSRSGSCFFPFLLNTLGLIRTCLRRISTDLLRLEDRIESSSHFTSPQEFSDFRYDLLGKTMFSDSEMNILFRIHALMRILTGRAKCRSLVRNTRASVRAKSILVGVSGSQNRQSTSTVAIPSVIDAVVGRARISPRPRFFASVHVKSPV